MKLSRSVLLATAFSAALACTRAGAASFEGTAVIGKLRIDATDLTTGATAAAGYSFNTGASSFVGSLTSIAVEASQPVAGAPDRADPTFVGSVMPHATGPFGAPFDTTQPLRTVSAQGQTASVTVAMNAITATVSTGAVSGHFGYAEGNVAALTLAGGRPALTQNTLLVDARTQVTITASATVFANLADAGVCANCDAQFTGFAALIGGDQLAAYIAASQGDNSLRAAALQAAGISFVALDGVQLNDTSMTSASADSFLTLTFVNDTDTTQGYGFLAGVWINGNSNPGAAPVPEPATAAMALAGLALIGRTLRRRQRA